MGGIKNQGISIWSESVNGSESESSVLRGDTQTDVLIVGAGLVGILTAWKLKQAGVSCIVLDAKTAGSGVTQNTTAKITAQHGLVYTDLIRRFGFENARLYYEANTNAIESYRILDSQFPCDFQEQTAYVYSADNRAKLEHEAIAYQNLGIGADIKKADCLPFQTAEALAMKGQAQFNPMKLLTALSRELNIYDHTFVRDITSGKAITEKGTVRARHIVLATHFPMVNIPGLYFLKLYQRRSYVLALKGASPIDGMYIDAQQDGHSFRSYGDLLLLGGGGHKTGKKGGGYAALESLVKRAYPHAEVKYQWATQDCMTLDGVPYIGRHRGGEQGLYVATGFNKWGITGSMVASELLCDLIVNGRSDLETLYSPQRSIWTKQLAVNAGSAAAGLLSVGGPRCPHMGCKLKKNSAEGTWDCSCHGSRFDQAGHLINNPAKKGVNL